ncbi:MAG: hypothetical protein U1A77_08705 [Pirellulales bacterium]
MDFHKAVDEFENHASADSMDRIVGFARSANLDDENIAYLALSLARSGSMLKWREGGSRADIASTGGPSSLSTILCPLFLRQMEVQVPKLGVPGRPAGGIDVLAQIPGYRVHFDESEVCQILDRCGYVHFLAEGRFAPRDGQLYTYRKQHDAVNLPELAIASLLSKKIAVGITKAGLDVRVAPHGNLGTTWAEAKRNAVRFNRVAKLVGIEAVCILTDARLPYQPFIGRGEALIAMDELLAGKADAWLTQHYRQCFAMAKVVSGVDSSLPSASEILPAFQSNLEAQGASVEAFNAAVSAVRRKRRFEMLAAGEGFLTIDLECLRETLVRTQIDFQTEDTPFPDTSGVILASRTGDYVTKRELLATVRCEETKWPEIEPVLRSAFVLSESPGRLAGFEEVVDA